VDVSVERVLQTLGEEVVKNRLLEEHIAMLEASLTTEPPASEEEVG